MRIAFVITVAVFTLAACGGGGSGGKSVSMTPPSATQTILAEGAAAVRAAQAQRLPVADRRIAFMPGTDLYHGHYKTDGLPEPLAADVKHMPIYRDDDRNFVGVAQTALRLRGLPVIYEQEGFDVRWGYLRDGNSKAAVVEYLESAAPNGGPSLVRYTEPPVVRIIGNASAREASSVNAAVRLVNASLPEWAKMTIGFPLPDETSTDDLDDEGQWTPREGTPGNTIFVEFLPCSEFHAGCESGVAGTASAIGDSDSSTRRIINGLIQINTSVEETNIDTERGAAIVLAHELIHTLGIGHVRAGFASIMLGEKSEGGPFLLSQGGALQPLSLLYPMDREALQALYGALDPGDSPEDLGDWSRITAHAAGHGEHTAFGVALRNGYAEPWAYGLVPETDLADSRALSGSAVWTGILVGWTPDADNVQGDARIGVNLFNMKGRADFTDLSMWEDEDRVWHTWLDGDLGYTIEVRGNTFRETGGDDGRLTGIFTGASHEGAAGTLERPDLTAAFGAERR